MNNFCDVCGERKITKYCENCPKNQFYCDKCFKFCHNNDSSRQHPSRLISSMSQYGKSIYDILKCSKHEGKQKIYICMSCNIPVCLDCTLVGSHKKHDIGTFKDGLNKLGRIFNKELPKYEDAKTSVISVFGLILDDKINQLQSVRTKLVDDVNDLITTIKAKRDVLLRIIDEQINGMNRNKNTLSKSIRKFTDLLSECRTSLRNIRNPKCYDYTKFKEDNQELDNIRATIGTDLNFYILNESKYNPIDLKKINSSLDGIKVSSKSFSSDYRVFFAESNILTDLWDRAWVASLLLKKNMKFSTKLLWKGSKDGFDSSIFHDKCDYEDKTLTIIRSSNGCVFGGYASKPWKPNANYFGFYRCYSSYSMYSLEPRYENDTNAFIYSLTHRKVLLQKPNCYDSLYISWDLGPSFGKGDIEIDGKNGSSTVNTSYGIADPIDADTYLAGSKNFTVDEIEVYSIVI